MVHTHSPARQRLDGRRIGVFCGIAFGLAWAIALIIWQTGGLVNSPSLIPGTPITLALVLLALGYMWAPAVAHLCTRLLTREGWHNLLLHPRLQQGWPYCLAAWILPSMLTILGGAVFFAVFSRYF